MEINLIREKIADKLGSSEVNDIWVDILQDTTPGNYGVEDIEINVDIKDIWVDIPERTFTFKNAELIFYARLGGSSEKNGYDQKFSLVVSGDGKFDFTDKSQDIKIMKFTINEDLDLYSRN